MESPGILFLFVFRENIVENPEIHLFGSYVLVANFGFSCSFLCVVVRLWFFVLFCTAFPS